MRVATFNIKHSALMEGYRGHPDKVIEACQQINADILALQEVDNGVLRSKRADLARVVADAAGMEVIFAATQNFTVGQYGNALLIRGKIANAETIVLGGRTRFNTRVFGREVGLGFEGRNAIVATAVIENEPVSVAATHLSTRDKELSAWQLGRVASSLTSHASPRILLGDFNRGPSATAPTVEMYGMELVAAPATYPANEPVRRIDHIAVSREIMVTNVETIQLPISDHRALIADIQIRG